MLNAVADSGPLIHLHEIGQINLLNLFTNLIVPASVVKEIGKFNLKNIAIIQISKEETAEIVEYIKTFKLQKAEIDALYLANKANTILLTDDLEARSAANKLNIEVHGSLGIIALAYKKGLINLEKAKELIIDLYYKSTLFLTKSIVDITIKELEKKINSRKVK